MFESTRPKRTLQQFLNSSEANRRSELIDGEVVLKATPCFFHASTRGALLELLSRNYRDKGRTLLGWSLLLKRRGQDWVPAPDIVYVSYERLSADWRLDEACPVAPELAIEILSPGQTLNEFAAKAADYLDAGLSQVWVVDAEARTITVFRAGDARTYRSAMPIEIDFLGGLQLSPDQVFEQAEI